jgi:hypothetical protein
MAVIFYSTVHFARTVGIYGNAMRRAAIAQYVAFVSISQAMNYTKSQIPMSSFAVFRVTGKKVLTPRTVSSIMWVLVYLFIYLVF